MRHARRYLAAALLAAVTLPAAPPTPLSAQQQPGVGEYGGAAGLGLAMRRLGTTKRVLMVGAHPDDEDTQLLAALALAQGADVAYLSLTRGEGGQNGIGPELHEALGLLRTEELLAARRVDGARQFFTRAYDFGFSKSAEETFRHWPREEVLADVVRTIRLFRPDVVIPVFSGTPRDGHGHHQVSGMLAREAFAAAGDSARFPEQIRAGLQPWKPAKLYQSLRGGAEGSTVRLAVGDLDPLLGRSHFQLAMASRSLHRSQDMGRPEPAGPRWNYLRREIPEPAGPEESIWVGIDTTLAPRQDAGDRCIGGVGPPPCLRAYDVAVRRLRAELNPLQPERLVPGLAAALGDLRRAAERLDNTLSLFPSGPIRESGDALRFRVAEEIRDAERALALASGLVLDATVDDARLAPGETAMVQVSLWNGGRGAVRVSALEPLLPPRWEAEALDSLPREVRPNSLAVRRFRVRVPADEAPSEPYFLRLPRQGDLYAWPGDAAAAGLPFQPAPVRARAAVGVEGAGVPLETEATFADVDLRQGEIRRGVSVVPAVSVRLEPATTVVPLGGTGAPAPLRYRVRLASEAPDGIAGTLRLRLPAGWSAEPSALPLRFARPGESRDVEVTVRAPAGTPAGDHRVEAVFEAADGRRFARGVQWVDYAHVRARPLYHPAASVARAFELRVPANLKVAYVTGAGEEGPGLLAQVGITPDLLDEGALATADLSRYDVVVTGSRAYEVRPDLAQHNARLLEYVRRGGTMVVLYNKYELVEGRFTPYPLTMARPHGRVTDEAAPVRVLVPDHPVFTGPNRITERDFAGWVQERGLYFAQTWDPAYTPLLETGDPGEDPLRGGLLVARHGQGTYVYTGLAFFRQLPEGVPGAWRLFANLLALGARR